MNIQKRTINNRPQAPVLRKTIFKIIGMLLVVSSLIMIVPILTGCIYQDGSISEFIEGFALLFLSGISLIMIYRKERTELKIRNSFIIVGLSWIIIGLSCALPLYISDELPLSLVDSVFESVSALTTTGATVINHLDDLPHSILIFRQLLQWLGGMGIIVLAIAILPMLQIGGMQMFKAETPGPMKEQKLTPRIAETAKALWLLYLGMTIACALAYYLAGMDLFDAISHAFSTVSTGGMSPHDDSLAYFNNSLIELIAIFFMFIAGINFASHFLAWRTASMKEYYNDTEVRVYFGIVIAVTIIISLYFILNNTYPTLYEDIRHSLFQVVSMITTTGFTTENISTLPHMIPLLLIFLGVIGASAGSTSGGIKLVRVILIFKLSMRELYRLIHPHGKFIIKMDGKTVNYRVLDSISAFLFQFVFIVAVFTLIVMLLGENMETASSTVLSSVANIGPALGDAGTNFSQLSDGSKWTLAFAMIVGRLEVFTIFILMIPAYWES